MPGCVVKGVVFTSVVFCTLLLVVSVGFVVFCSKGVVSVDVASYFVEYSVVWMMSFNPTDVLYAKVGFSEVLASVDGYLEETLS